MTRVLRRHRPGSLRLRLVRALALAGIGGGIAIAALLAILGVHGFQSAAGSILLLLLVLARVRHLIGRFVLTPLHRIETHMQSVRRTGQPMLLDEVGLHDEFASLAHSVNAMLAQQRELRERIEAQGFALGRSEAAAAVMHNVRNALNPVTTIIGRGLATPAPVNRASVDRALAELARGDLSADRRGRLAAFVAASIAAEGAARDEMRRELAIARNSLAHALDIIGHRQADLHAPVAVERCDVSAIVARNAVIAHYADPVSIAFSFPGEAHHVIAHHLLLSQVVGNLLCNAAEAIAATGATSGTIDVTIRDAADRVEIAMRDSGEGFVPGAEAAFFARGYSTRDHKSGGLGLHWCANSMTAMGGSLRLSSEGPGRGAVATLVLPAPPAEALAA